MKDPLLVLFTCISYLGPVILGIRAWKRLSNVERLFLGYCTFLFFEHIVQISFALRQWNNLEISHYGILVENFLLAGVFIIAGGQKIFQTIQYALVIIYLGSWALITTFYHVPGRIDSLAITFGMVIIVCFGIVYMFEALTQKTTNLGNDSIFWVASGSLFYNIGAILIIGFANELVMLGYSQFHETWQINLLLIIASNLIYMKSFLCPTT